MSDWFVVAVFGIVVVTLILSGVAVVLWIVGRILEGVVWGIEAVTDWISDRS